MFRFAFIWENKKKERQRAQYRAEGRALPTAAETAFANMTDKENPK